MEAFSDSVFAIAITLLILEIRAWWNAWAGLAICVSLWSVWMRLCYQPER